MKKNISLLERYSDSICGTISCFDRFIVHGTLNPVGHPQGMTSYLYAHTIRIFDFPQFAKEYTSLIRAHIASVASANTTDIIFIRKRSERKEDRIATIIKTRGNHPGLVAILSAMEACSTFQPWHDKKTGKTFLRHDSGKCLHYYCYFIDPDFGLGYIRIPTWLPCRLQVYFNGHNWLANQMDKHSITYTLIDNLFTNISSFSAAQNLSDSFTAEELHAFLDRITKSYCPAMKKLGASYHWSIMQAEYATDIVFSSRKKLSILYNHISRTAVIAVKAQDIATFLGRRLHANYQDNMGNHFNTRIEGTRIRHSMGSTSIKAYDKLGVALRLETVTNDVSFFKHFRDVQKADGTIVNKIASMRKSIYSISDLALIMRDANLRYLDFLSSLDDPTNGASKLEKLSHTISDHNHPYKGFNFFDSEDLQLLRTIARGEFNIRGFQNKHLRTHLKNISSSKATRIIKRLRIHGLIRKVRGAYKYMLTSIGKKVVALGLKIKEFFIMQNLALC